MSSDSHTRSYYDVARKMAPRFPIRWRWAIVVGAALAGIVVMLTLLILDMEREAWRKSQAIQAEVLVDRLGDELKIPMLAGSTAEVDIIIGGFLKNVPAVLGVHVQNAAGDERHYGDMGQYEKVVYTPLDSLEVERLPLDMWFAKRVAYAGTDVGVVAVRYSERAWEELVKSLLWRMILAALFAIVVSTLLVFWIAGRFSKPMEAMALAAKRVADGDYSVRLSASGNDEISDAVHQFNAMVDELAHKVEIRDIFGRYLNPQLVDDVFDKRGVIADSERRQEATVLFADMVDFTEFAESTATEEVVKVLNRYFEVFHGIIDYYGGHVDKYIGDAVMAVFNTPRAHPQHVRHAAMAALGMGMACNKLAILRHTGDPISFRIGVNRGEVIVGNIGAAERLEYTVIGDTVNLASRMAAVGNGNEVMMSRKSLEALGPEFHFEGIETIHVKGKSEPVECGRLHCVDEMILDNIRHAVALAFDITLPSNVRHIIGDKGEA